MFVYSHFNAILLAFREHITIRCVLSTPLIGKSFWNWKIRVTSSSLICHSPVLTPPGSGIKLLSIAQNTTLSRLRSFVRVCRSLPLERPHPFFSVWRTPTHPPRLSPDIAASSLGTLFWDGPSGDPSPYSFSFPSIPQIILTILVALFVYFSSTPLDREFLEGQDFCSSLYLVYLTQCLAHIRSLIQSMNKRIY